jgi:hypothetical protein
MKLSRWFWIIGAFMLFATLVLVILRAAKVFTTKTLLIILGSFYGAVILFFIIKKIIKILMSRKPVAALPSPGLMPSLDFQGQIIPALKKYFAETTFIRSFTDKSTGETIYPEGSFVWFDKRYYEAGAFLLYAFEVMFEAGLRKGQFWTIRVLANQTVKDIANGNRVAEEECPLIAWKRRPLEFPDIPALQPTNALLQQLVATDIDYLKRNPELLALASGSNLGTGAGKSAVPSPNIDTSAYDEHLHQQNVYDMSKKSPYVRKK